MSKFKALESFWRKADCWRKLLLLRLTDAINTSMGRAYLDEMMCLQNVDGGFAKRLGGESYVTWTAEAIVNLISSGLTSSSKPVVRALNFIWGLQKENGS